MWWKCELRAWEYEENICRAVVAGERGSQGSRVKAGRGAVWLSVSATLLVVWLSQDANEVAKLFDKHRWLLLAQSGRSGRTRLGVDEGRPPPLEVIVSPHVSE